VAKWAVISFDSMQAIPDTGRSQVSGCQDVRIVIYRYDVRRRICFLFARFDERMGVISSRKFRIFGDLLCLETAACV